MIRGAERVRAHRRTRTLVFASVLLLSVSVSIAPVSAREYEGRYISSLLLIHGFELSSQANCNQFSALLPVLEGWGWQTGAGYGIRTLKYYASDRNCSVDIGRYGKFANGDSRNHSEGFRAHSASVGHNNNTPIEHLAYHLAWFINKEFMGVPEVAAHSMGGLIARYALMGSTKYPSYFPKFRLEDAVTVGTPHAGTHWCMIIPASQCRQMESGSDFMDEIEHDGQNPQGTDLSGHVYNFKTHERTQWSLIGAGDDDNVTWQSATGMRAAHKEVYSSGQGLEHSSYFSAAECKDRWDRASTYRDYEGSWYESTSTPRICGRLDFGGAFSEW